MHKKILITSGRSPVTLDLARQLQQAGHTIFIADSLQWHICRFSNAVSKSFVIRSPKQNTQDFIEDLVRIVKQEKIDLLIPVYEEALYLAQHQERFPSHCQVFVSSFSLLKELHNKWLFNQKLQQMEFDYPKSFLIQTKEDLKQLDPSKNYALKASYSRAGLKIYKLSTPHEMPSSLIIEPSNPWIAQEWLEGGKFCTYSVCHQGSVLAHATYPVGYTVDGKGCIVFEAIDHPAILKWVQRFVKKTGYTGQIAFDLIELPDQRLFAIECNPRATSGAHLFSPAKRLDQAFLNNTLEPISPSKGYSRQLAIAMLLYGWKRQAHADNTVQRFIKTLVSVQDIIFSYQDMKPLLMQPFVFLHLWLHSRRANLSLPAFFVFDYEWNGEVNQNRPLA